jgi:GNAT superfamily N-acetyltransferase
MSDVYFIRPYKTEDKSFILATFLRGIYFGDSWFSLVPKDIFMINYAKIAEALLSRSYVAVACLTEDPDVILGYSMLSRDAKVVHFIFVKKAFRNQGIGKALVPEGLEFVTHLTNQGRSLMHRYPGVVFNPFRLE